MVLTEMQKKIIADNPKASVKELASMAHCSERTIKLYRQKYREAKEGKIGQKEGQIQVISPAHAISVEGGNLPQAKKILTPQEILEMGTELCISELAFMRLANARLEVEPDNPKTLWSQKQHVDSLTKGLNFMGKATGLEKEATINILNVNNKNGLNDKQIDRLQQLLRKAQSNALPE